MFIVFFIVLSLALGISAMLLMYRCAEATPVQLSSGMLVSFTTAVVHVVLFCLGIYLGNKLHFVDANDPTAYARQNALVLLGLAVIVALKQLFPYMGRRTQLAVLGEYLHAALWPLLVFTFLFSVLGVMFGRQHVPLRPRRWIGLSSMIIFMTALCVVLFI